ncbi:MAG TPA: glycosyltransferase family 1 protein [Longimicrobium sp.]|nr:glycosyltransferase family 1 protein [Longimicrobium sp.]
MTEPRAARAADGDPPVRVGIVCDYPDEGWPSMDLAGELLALGLETYAAPEFVPVVLRPPMPRLARRLGSSRLALNADRCVGRYLTYPRWLEKLRHKPDLFHVVDHSYAHLVHALPAGRTVVTCHDLDAFRSILEPQREPRPYWFRKVMEQALTGLRRAAHVVCDTSVIRRRLVVRGVLPWERISVVPLPVHPDFAAGPDPVADAEAARLLGPPDPRRPDLLHVGSTVPRKRIPFLLHVFAGLRRRWPDARLVRVGGPMTDRQREVARDLGVEDAVLELPRLERPVLAAVYRRAALVLAPSGREGFGLPLVEAMACGTPVVASSLRVFREVGGEAVIYRHLKDRQGWVDAVDSALWTGRDPREASRRRDFLLERAERFGLEAYARRLVRVYRRLER